MNSFIFVATGLSKTDGIDIGYSFNGKWYPTIVMAVIGLGLLYYFVVFAAYVPSPFYDKSLMQLGNVTCDISKQPKFDMGEESTRRFGHRRDINIIVSSPFFLRIHYRYLGEYDINANIFQVVDFIPKWKAFLFWIFGGNWSPSPLKRLEYRWESMNQTIDTLFISIKTWFTFKKKASQTAGSVEGQVSREISRPGSQDEILEMGALSTEGARVYDG
jgi:hypothetical protein